MATTLAEVLRRFGPQYLREHRLSSAQAKAWRAIVGCRTPALGGQRWRCEGCGAEGWRWHSCRNRHCPQCQSREREAWRAARLAELLEVPYCHLVFTLPHAINALAAAHPRWVYETLLQAVSQTLAQFAADARWLGGIGAFTLVLHTWTQELRRHLHVHALMACGGLHIDASGAARWVEPRRGERFLFPVHALSRVFRGKFLAALRRAECDGTLGRDPQATPAQRRERTRRLLRHDWVVYAKAPLAGPAQLLDYLSRYTQRNAIGNERLLGIVGDKVRLRVRADAKGGRRTVELPGVEFIGRLLEHVLPPGFKRIRHYGLLAPAAKARRLALARQLLGMPQADPRTREEVRDFMRRVAAIDIQRCPHCRSARLLVIEELAPQRSATLMPWRTSLGQPACRGPP